MFDGIVEMVTDDGYEAIASLLDNRIPGGHMSVVGRTLTHRKASYELRVTRTAEGTTELQLKGDYRADRIGTSLRVNQRM